jgi:hypothetical protein
MSASDSPPDIEAAWDSRWWEKPIWRDRCSLSDARISELMSVLRSVFDAGWQAENPDYPRHPVYQKLVFGEGISQFGSLLAKAKQYELLRNVHGFKRVREGYENPETWEAADLEMLMGEVFSHPGFEPEYIVPRSRMGKTPDLLVSTEAGRFTIECKRLQEAAGEQWIGRYQMKWPQYLREAAEPYGLFLDGGDKEIDIRDYGYPDSLSPPSLSAAIDAVPLVALINSLKQKSKINVLVSHQKFKLALLGGQLGSFGSMTVPGLSEKFLLRRGIGNGLKAGSKQVMTYYEKEGVPGVVSIWQGYPCDFSRLGRTIVKELMKPVHKGVMGVIVHQMGNILTYQPPLWIKSPSYRYEPVLEAIESRFIQAFDPEIFP